MGRIKLRIDPVPETCSRGYLRDLLPPGDWERLCRQMTRSAKGCCQSCGARDDLMPREVWRYSKRNYTRKLRTLRALCNRCYQATYLGFQCRLHDCQERLQLNVLIEHMLLVNSVNITWLISHRKRALSIWNERSQSDWRTDLGIWRFLIESRSANRQKVHSAARR